MADLGRFVWFDLNTTDPEAGRTFYTECVGWQTMPWEHGDKPYTMFTVGEQPIGGSAQLPEEVKAMGVPPHWLHYIKVDNMETTIAKITAGGGKVLNGLMEVPGGDFIAQCMAPQGAAFAVVASP